LSHRDRGRPAGCIRHSRHLPAACIRHDQLQHKKRELLGHVRSNSMTVVQQRTINNISAPPPRRLSRASAPTISAPLPYKDMPIPFCSRLPKLTTLGTKSYSSAGDRCLVRYEEARARAMSLVGKREATQPAN
jgi:hypothetical protein